MFQIFQKPDESEIRKAKAGVCTHMHALCLDKGHMEKLE